jgi:hypothetical protein
MKTITKEKFLELLEWAMVIFVAIHLSVYGFGKVVQFGELTDSQITLSQLKPMQLMWAFYGYSKTYSIVLGAFEVLGSLLFILPKTQILGGFLLSGILINIILQDYFYEVHIGALICAIFYQFLICIVLFLNKKTIIDGIKSLVVQKSLAFEGNKLISVLLIFILLIIIYFSKNLLIKLF